MANRPIAAAAVVCLLLIARHLGRFFEQGIWEEDGVVFFRDIVMEGSWFLPFKPWAGYWHVGPRLIAALCAWMPAAWIPAAYYAFEHAVKSFCLAEFANAGYRPILRDDRIRLMACLLSAVAIDFLPEPGICNLNWFLALWSTVVLFREPGSAWGSAGRAVGVLIGALSSPQTLITAPVCVWKLWRGSGLSRLVPAALLIGIAIQLRVITQLRPPGSGAVSLADTAQAVPLALAYRCILTTLGGAAGMEWVTWKWRVGTGVGVALLCVAVSIVVIRILQHRESRPKVFMAMYLAVAAVTVAIAGRNFGAEFGTWFGFKYWVGQRYFILPSAMFIFLIAVAVDRARNPRAWMYAIPFLFLPSMVGNAWNVPLLAGAWQSRAAEIDSYREAKRAGRPHPPVAVKIQPEAWVVHLLSTRHHSQFPVYSGINKNGRRPGPISPAFPGIVRDGYKWVIDSNHDYRLEIPPDRWFDLGGTPNDIPVTGDWTGKGITRGGFFRGGSLFVIDSHGDDVFSRRDSVARLAYEVPKLRPITGDWTGDGRTKLGVVRETGQWLLDMNGDEVWDADGDAALWFSGPGDIPIVGDWDGDGTTNLGVVRQGFLWILDLNGNGKIDRVNEPGGDKAFPFGGLPGDIPVPADWNGDGKAEPAIRRSGNEWVIDSNGNYQLDPEDRRFSFGLDSDVPVPAKW